MNALIEYIEYYVKLSNEAKAEIEHLAVRKTLSKGTLIVDEGYVCREMYFLISGTVRSYFYQKGKDITYWIYPEHSFFTAWSSYLNQKTSPEFIETTEDAELYSISYTQWQQLYEKYPELERFGRLMIEEQIALIHEFYMGYYLLTAKEKYDLIVSVFPTITQRANLGHIASMLGISQETLSRIRGK